MLVDAVMDVNPALGRLITKGIVKHLGFVFASVPEPVFEAFLEEVFNGLQRSSSRLELDFNGCYLSYSSLECLYHTWNRCTDMKLKKLDLTGNELPQDTSNLQQMTDKLICASVWTATSLLFHFYVHRTDRKFASFVVDA